MAHQWTKTTKTWDWDGYASDNSPEPVPLPRFVFRSDKLEIEESYDISFGAGFQWRREIHHLNGSGEVMFISSSDVRITRTSTTETLEQRRNDGDWEVGWVMDLTVNPPTNIFTYTSGFEFLTPLGSKEFWEIYSIDDVPGEPLLVGSFDVRDLRLSNVRSEKQQFNPLREGTIISADILALPAPNDSFLFPSGWLPTSSLAWRYELEQPPLSLPSDDGAATLLTLDPDSGKIGEIVKSWNGKDTSGEIVEGRVNINMRVLADVPGTGNALSQSGGETLPFCRRCADLECPLRSGELVLQSVLPVAAAGIAPVLSYFSSLALQGAASFGYGWRSTSSEKMYETGEGALVYESDNDIVMRWEPDGNGGYDPVNDDNYIVAEKLGAGEYRLTFRSQSVREFSGGRVSADIDRDGNVVTYTYSGGHLATVSDGQGRIVIYDYGSRSDGQPVAIRSDDPVTGRAVQMVYYPDSHLDSPNRLLSITDPTGEVTEFDYWPEGPIKTITLLRPEKGDQIIEHFYDFYGKIERTVVNGELETRYLYGQKYLTRGDPAEPVRCDTTYVSVWDLTSEDPEPKPARKTLYYYNADGNLVRIEEGAAPVYDA